MGPICLGVLSTAEIVHKHIRAIEIASNNLRIVAIGSRSLEKAQSFCRDGGLEGRAKAYGSYQEVLDCPDVEAVYIPLPTGLHVEWVRKAVAANKHILLEKPIALTPQDLKDMMAAVRKAEVVFMDGTMWSHSPRAVEMSNAIKQHIGQPHDVKATFTFGADTHFLEKNIRLKPDLDGLGALGDLGWYTVRAALWVFGWEIPSEVTAHPGSVLSDVGVVIEGGATLLWGQDVRDGLEPRRSATVFFSFTQSFTQDLVVSGRQGQVRLDDFVIPHNEDTASFTVRKARGGAGLKALAVGTDLASETIRVDLKEPQEVYMWRNFAACIHVARGEAVSLEGAHVGSNWRQWADLAEETQLVVHAIAASIKQGCKPVSIF